MRVLLVNKYARVTGGADLHCLELANGLAARGHEVALLSTAHRDNLWDGGAFIPLTVTNNTRSDVSGLDATRVAARAIWNSTAASAAEKLFESFEPDVIHVHKLYPQLSVAPVVLASHTGIPIVQTVHDYEFISASAIDHTGGWRDRDESRAAYRALNSSLFAVKRWSHAPRVTAWISVSRSVAARYATRGIQCRTFPNFTRTRRGSISGFQGRSGVLSLGRLTEEKGVRDVLELARRVPDLPVRIAGDGPLRGTVQDACKTCASLTYLGPLDSNDAAEEIARARLVVMPSLWQEPGPLTALEAMAAGTPVVAYENGGLAEYIEDAGAGVAVPAEPTALVKAVSTLYGDPEKWDEASDGGRRAVEDTHSPDRYLDRLEQLYLNLRRG